MLKLTQELFGAADPELGREPETRREPAEDRSSTSGVIIDFSNYFRALSEDRKRANPTDDLASLIANSQIDGQPISRPGGDELLHHRRHRRARHHLVVHRRRDVGAGREPGGARQGQGRPVADPGPGRRVHPLDHAGEDLHAHGHRRHRVRAAATIEEGRLADALLRLGQPRRGGVRGARRRSASTASPTSTWPSATARTCAWASTWPRWRCGSSGRSCCRACIRWSSPATPAMSEAVFVNGPKRLPIRYRMT